MDHVAAKHGISSLPVGADALKDATKFQVLRNHSGALRNHSGALRNHSGALRNHSGAAGS